MRLPYPTFDTKSSDELAPSEGARIPDDRCPDVPSSEPTDACVGRDSEVWRRRDNVSGRHQYQVTKG